MKKPTKKRDPKKAAEANQYDKIFKENMMSVIPMLIRKVLNIQAAEITEINIDVQHTKERKTDYLVKMTDVAGETFILQLEFQSQNDHSMVFRMAEYCVMLARKYDLPVRQCVIFLGSNAPSMATRLDMTNLKFHYELVTVATIDYEIFLKFDRPEELLFALLGDFKNQNPSEVIQKIVGRLVETSDEGIQELMLEKTIFPIASFIQNS